MKYDFIPYRRSIVERVALWYEGWGWTLREFTSEFFSFPSREGVEVKVGLDEVCSTLFPYNPKHPIGTCAQCGEEMVYNVPRLGPDGGFVHKSDGSWACGIINGNPKHADN